MLTGLTASVSFAAKNLNMAVREASASSSGFEVTKNSLSDPKNKIILQNVEKEGVSREPSSSRSRRLFTKFTLTE